MRRILMDNLFDTDLSDEELSYLLYEAIEGTLDYYKISKEPDSNRLRSCLEVYTKDKLVNLAAENGVDVKKSWKKKRIIKPLYNNIFDTLPERVLLLDSRGLELLKKFVLEEFNSEEITFEETEFFVNVYPIAVRLGFLFSMGNGNGLKTVITAELLNVLNNLDAIKEENQEKIELAKQIDEVLKAAVHLYGVVDKTRVIKLWEIRYPDFKFTLDFYDYLETVLPILAIKNDFYTIDNRLIASPVFINSEEAEDYQLDILEKMGQDYYVPTQNDIQYYAEHSFNRQSNVYKKLKQFVSKRSDDSELVMLLIEEILVKSSDVSNFLSTLEESELLNIKTQKQLESFLDYYMKLLNKTRLWEVAGHKPVELRPEKTEKLVESLDNHANNANQEEKDHDNVFPLSAFQEKQ